jgi:3-hydroxyisobutyrate dehydrogenase-like beta-hydroxyacid dehydrogenase
MLGVVVDLIGQVFACGEKSGIDLQHLDAVAATLFAHPGLQEYAARMRARRYDDVGSDLPGGPKDGQLIVDAATEARAPLPFAGIVRDRVSPTRSSA